MTAKEKAMWSRMYGGMRNKGIIEVKHQQTIRRGFKTLKKPIFGMNTNVCLHEFVREGKIQNCDVLLIYK